MSSHEGPYYRPSSLDDPRWEATRRQGFYTHRPCDDRVCFYGRPGDFCVHVWNGARCWDSARISVDANGTVLIDTDPHGLLEHSLDDLARAIDAVRAHLADRDEGPDSGESGSNLAGPARNSLV